MAILRQSSRTDPDEIRMTLGEHLEELRSRLIRAIVAIVVGTILCFIFVDKLIALLIWPVQLVLRKHGFDDHLTTLSPAEMMITSLKVSMIVGIILTAPYSLSQIWGFVAAGLYPHERKWVSRFAPVSIALFFAGVAFMLFIVSPLLMNFLLAYQTKLPQLHPYMPEWILNVLELKEAPPDGEGQEPEELWPTSQPVSMPMFRKDPELTDEVPPKGVPWINKPDREVRVRIDDEIYTLSRLRPADPDSITVVPELRISDTIVFILQLAAAFGIGFQVPVVVAFIALIGVASAAEMGKMRRYIWFGMAIASAVITPPDPTSMIMLLGPMFVLLEFGLIAARLIERGRE